MPAKWQQWMPFKIDAFKASPSVQAMHPAARAGYLYLLSAAWQTDDCSLSSDPLELAEISGLGDELWSIHGPRILRKFLTRTDGRLVNFVLAKEWDEARRVFESRQNAADRTNKHRWSNGDRSVTDQGPNRSADTRTGTGTITETKTKETKTPEWMRIWNENCGSLSPIKTFPKSRQEKVRGRIAQGITPELFTQAVKCCADKPFLRGENPRQWKASFDWIVSNDINIEKAIGEYGELQPKRVWVAGDPDNPADWEAAIVPGWNGHQ